MKNRIYLLILLMGLLPTFGWSDASSYQLTGFTDILNTTYALRPQWSPDGQWIVYDDHDATNHFKVYRMHPDGSGIECLTCNRPEVPLSSGGAQIDVSGRYVAFSAEQAQHFQSAGSDPGGGYFNDLAILDLQTQTRSITRVHVVGSGLNGQPAGGTLFPRFSRSGTQIAWSDYLGVGGKFGAWQVMVADFIATPQPHVANIKTFAPDPRPDFYEIQGWTANDTGIVLSTAPLPNQDDNALDIAQLDLATGQISQLTFTAGVQGQLPAEYEEHADLSPQGDALAFMSSMGYGIQSGFFFSWLKSELWIANADGTNPRQQTFFNVPGHPEYTGQRVIVSMLSWAPDASALVASVYYYPDATHTAPPAHIMVFHFNTPPPSIGGIIFAGAFGAYQEATPGSFIEIYGRNMAPKIDTWDKYFVSGKAPTSLDTVSVKIGGQSAYISYISPTQVNVQVPANVPTGQNPVVLTYGLQPSPPVMLAMNPLEPGLLAPPSFKVAGTQYVVAFHANNSFVGNGNLPGIPTTPAKPGETIVFYGVGFGPANDQTGHSLPLAGQVITVDNTLAYPVQFMFGQSTGQIWYAGMAPNYTGLYQFNVTVPPDAANGDLPLTVTLNGNKLPQPLFISVHN